MPPTPTPDPSPQGGKDVDALIQSGVQGVIEEAVALIAALKTAREEMQETGRYAQAAALGRDLNAITNVLYRAKRMQTGSAAEPEANDEFSDLDERRRAVARRILQFLESRRIGILGGAGEPGGHRPADG